MSFPEVDEFLAAAGYPQEPNLEEWTDELVLGTLGTYAILEEELCLPALLMNPEIDAIIAEAARRGLIRKAAGDAQNSG